jgi:hypothetical protein
MNAMDCKGEERRENEGRRRRRSVMIQKFKIRCIETETFRTREREETFSTLLALSRSTFHHKETLTE